VETARGNFITFCDDDDRLSDDFMATILGVTVFPTTDVITFNEDCTWNNMRGIINYQLGNPFEEMVNGGTFRRPPLHVSAWRRALALLCKFPDKNWNEDREWGWQACQLAKNGIHIDRVLRYYVHKDEASEATIRQSKL